MPRKIAIVTYSLRVGGMESVIFNLAKSLERNGYLVEVIETLEQGMWKKYFQENNINVISFSKRANNTACRHSKKIASYLNNFNIILLNDAPYAQSALGFLKEDILVFPIMHMALPSMAINASGSYGQWNKIVAVSPLLKDYLLNQVKHLNEKDIVVIPNGIDVAEFVYSKKSLDGRKNILYLGRLAKEKGVELLPEIVNQIKYNPEFNCLDIYGAGPLEEALRLSIEKYDLSEKINLKGEVAHSSVSEILSRYDILLMPSYKEGHPIALLEAMACGVVPVVSRLGGATDIVVEHGSNGYLCAPGNVEEFCFNLCKAIKNNDFAGLSERARNGIVERYTIEAMCKKYIKLFCEFDGAQTMRNNELDKNTIGDLPYLFFGLVRPVRKILRVLGIWKEK